MITGLTPKEIVKKLDEFIIGQNDAKRAVAVALRNRSRRMALGDDPIQSEIHPKNIILIGPTGVGKTEIARRLSKLANAPFVKVEATKFTEVGYVGRDVESMIRDLVNDSLKMTRAEHEKIVREKAHQRTEERIVDILMAGDKDDDAEEKEIRDIFRKKLKNGKLEDKEIEVKAQTSSQPMMQVMAMPGMEDIENQMQSMLGDLFPKKKTNKKMPISEARKVILEDEIEALLDIDKIKSEAIEKVEQSGIVFIDEVDKITARESRGGGPDVSREGVQRDILPLIEGSIVNTKHGVVKTDHILFIAAGAFHLSSVSDLIPELQGRFPIRVELKSLTQEDYVSILSNPKNALSKQYQALMSTEGIALKFSKNGLKAIAKIAYDMNTKNENIGARRLHTIMERLLEDLSFNAEKYKNQEIAVDDKFVNEQLKDVLEDQDLSKYIL